MNSPLRQCIHLFRTELVSLAIFSLCINLLMLAPTLYMLQLYDRVLISQNELTLYAVTLITCVLLAGMALCEWARSLIAVRSGVKFDRLLGSRIFKLGFASAHGNAPETMQDLTQLRQFMTSQGLFAFFDVPMAVLFIGVLLILHPLLGLAAGVFCLIQFGLALWNQRSCRLPLQRTEAAALANQQFIEAKARNIETLHVMGMVPHLFARWQTMRAHWSALEQQANALQAGNGSLNRFARYSMQSLMLGLGALLAIQGKISIGSMIASNVLIARALQPFDVIVGTWRQYSQARQAACRLDQMLAAESVTAPAIAAIPVSGHVVLRNLTVFLESASKPVLQDISLNIVPGRILTVMGHSGSGKTTLARCLAGLCTWQGEFNLDGADAASLSRSQWADALGYLPQDIGLLEGSIAENIARFSKVDPEAVVAAAKLAGVHDTILRLPQGYDSRLDEASRLLSGGQQQLLGLARAIYKLPSLIVLDEPNSHLDEHGEARLLALLAKLKNEGRAVVLISHRKGILRITDQLLVLKNGRMLHYGERGTVLAAMAEVREVAVQAA